MKKSVDGRKNGILWTLWNQLDDLDFAGDIALLSHSHTHIQEKITHLEESAAKLGLSVKLSRVKTKTMRINKFKDNPLQLEKGSIKKVLSFTYLESITSTYKWMNR